MPAQHARVTSLLCAAVAVSIVAGCSAAGGSPSSAPTPSLPACALAALPSDNPQQLATPPPGFPSRMPLPAGTHLIGSTVSGSQIAIDAVVPGTLSQAAQFMTSQLPAAGFKITASDAEQDEAEASFSGSGVTGRFRLHGISACNDAVTLTLSVTPT